MLFTALSRSGLDSGWLSLVTDYYIFFACPWNFQCKIYGEFVTPGQFRLFWCIILLSIGLQLTSFYSQRVVLHVSSMENY